MTSRIISGAVALIGLAAQTFAWADPPPKKVLIIGIDGTQPAVLQTARTPNLDALRTNNGCWSYRAVTHPTTHSAACWSSFFTGVWGDKNGVNDPNNAMTPNSFSNYPSFFHRLKRANTNLYTVALARWSAISEVWRTPTNAPGGADLVQSFGSDAAITTATSNILATNHPDVLFTILLDVDSAGHSSGWGSSNYLYQVQLADSRVGQMMNALTHRVNYTNEDWLVIVLSDHGAHDGTTEQTRITFHIVNGRNTARGVMNPSPSIVDLCATVLTHMEVPINPAWNLDARVEGLPLPPPGYGTNLLFNSDAESNSGTNNYAVTVDHSQTSNRGIAWWFDPSPLTLGVYGSHPNFPTAASPGPASRGRNFFLGGLGTSNAITQTLDLSSLAADIDDPGVDYQLSGWFGGAGWRTNITVLGVRFLNGTNGTTGLNSVGGATAADRGGVTGLISCSTNGTVPAGTRLVEFKLTMLSGTTTNDASADNLSFVLTPRPDARFPLLAWRMETGHWDVEFNSRTNRSYVLERSANCADWFPASLPNNGTGVRMTLTDTNPPADQAFYRVNCLRP